MIGTATSQKMAISLMNDGWLMSVDYTTQYHPNNGGCILQNGMKQWWKVDKGWTGRQNPSEICNRRVLRIRWLWTRRLRKGGVARGRRNSSAIRSRPNAGISHEVSQVFTCPGIPGPQDISDVKQSFSSFPDLQSCSAVDVRHCHVARNFMEVWAWKMILLFWKWSDGILISYFLRETKGMWHIRSCQREV